MSDELSPSHDPEHPEGDIESLADEARRNAILSAIIKTTLPLVVIAFAVGVFFLLGAAKKPKERDLEKAADPEVEVVPIAKHDGTLILDVNGEVVPYREIRIAAELAGKITFKSERCNAGKYVRGAPKMEDDSLDKFKILQQYKLMQIDPRDYEIAWKKLGAQKNEANTNLKELETQITNIDSLVTLAVEERDLQRNEVNRLRSLLSSGVVTQSQFDAERRNLIKTENSLKTLQNEKLVLVTRRARLESVIQQTELELKKTLYDYERTIIVSPCDGVIVSDPVEEGSYVNKGAELLVIEDTSAAEVRCKLRMDQLLWIWNQPRQNGDQARDTGRLPLPTDPAASSTTPEGLAETMSPIDEAYLANAEKYEIPETDVDVVFAEKGRKYYWPGKLKWFDGIGLDNDTRTIPCRVVVPDPLDVRARSGVSAGEKGPPALLRNMFVAIEIKVRVNPELSIFSIPEKALQPGDFLWRVRDGKATRIKADVIGSHGENVYVNVPPGELVNSPTPDRVVISPVSGMDPDKQTKVTEILASENGTSSSGGASR